MKFKIRVFPLMKRVNVARESKVSNVFRYVFRCVAETLRSTCQKYSNRDNFPPALGNDVHRYALLSHFASLRFRLLMKLPNDN